MPGPPHPGLEPKKISVLRKGSRRHMQTYWIKPKVAQIVRLRRAKHAGEQNVTTAPLHTGVPQTVHPREGIRAWFRERGSSISDNSIDGLVKLFKKPDGSLVSADDFERMFKNPGNVTLPVLETYDGNEDWGRPKTRAVKDSNGQPKSQDLFVRLSVTGITANEHSATVNLDVMARRRHPVGHAQAGEPYGDEFKININHITRTFSKTMDAEYGPLTGVRVEHDFFMMEPEFSGGGMGKRIVGNQFASYPQIGVSDVTVGTAWMGTYVWGRMGFTPKQAYQTALLSTFSSGIRDLQAGPKKIFKTEGVPYTADELLSMHDLRIHPSYEVFSQTVPAWNPVTRRMFAPDAQPQPWKDIILDHDHNRWKGHLKIEPGAANYEHMREYNQLVLPRTHSGRAAQDAAARAEAERVIREKPLREAESASFRSADEAAANAREEARRVAAEEAQRVEREAAQIRAPILNPAGQPTLRELSDFVERRIDSDLYRDAQQVPVAGRADWIAAGGGPTGREARVQAVRAMTGELSQARANAAAELARRHTAAGQLGEVGRWERTAQEHVSMVATRAAEDVRRGNTQAAAQAAAVATQGTVASPTPRTAPSTAPVAQTTAPLVSRPIANLAHAAYREFLRNQGVLQQLPPAERDAWVAQGGYRGTGLRQQALDEMLGVSSQRRADAATADAAALSAAGNASGATTARARARRETAEANRYRVEEAAREVVRPQREAEAVADRARAAALVPRQQAEVTRLENEAQTAQAAWRSAAYATPARTAAGAAYSAANGVLLQAWEVQAQLQHLSLGNYGATAHLGQTGMDEAGRQAARTTMTAKEARAGIVPAPPQPIPADVVTRAQALLPQQRTEVARLEAAVAQANDERLTHRSMGRIAAMDEAQQTAAESSSQLAVARQVQEQLENITARVYHPSAEPYREALASVEAKEGRIVAASTRQAEIAADRAVDRARAASLVPHAEAELARRERESADANRAVSNVTQRPDIISNAEWAALRATQDQATAALHTAVTARDRLQEVAGGRTFPAQETTARFQRAMTAKEGRIETRRVEAETARQAVEAARVAQVAADRPRARALEAAATAEVARTEAEAAQSRQALHRVVQEQGRGSMAYLEASRRLGEADAAAARATVAHTDLLNLGYGDVYGKRGEADRQAARVGMAAKEARVEIRRQEAEAAEQATRAAERARAQALLPAAAAEVERRRRAAIALVQTTPPSFQAPPGYTDTLRERARAARRDVVDAQMQELHLRNLATGQQGELGRRYGMQAVVAKEGRIEARRAAEVERVRQEAEAASRRAEKERVAAEEEAARAARKAEKAREADQVARLAAARKAQKAAEAEVAHAAAVEAARTAGLPAMRPREGRGRRSQLLRRL